MVNLFFMILKFRAPSDVGAPKCCFMNTSFYPKLAESGSGYTFKNVERWTRNLRVLDNDMVLVPIHCHGNHWTLAVINLLGRRFEYYDSLRGPPLQVLAHLRHWLQDVAAQAGSLLDSSSWKEVSYNAGFPTQPNGYDCGVFMCRTAEYIARDGLLDFEKSDSSYLRRRMVLELLRKSLLVEHTPQASFEPAGSSDLGLLTPELSVLD